MNKKIFFLFISILFSEDTFSIVAVDPETNQVGSAGASCIGGSIIISDIHPGVGVIHTQSYWSASNQNYASSLMNLNYSPNDIIEELINNDVSNNPSIRQYGIIDLVDGGRSAAYTGDNCSDYKGHILGDTYAIQGNILLGSEILENMEYQFINTEGTLAEKLMASLQGANIPGADARCLDDNLSSLSAFIRLAEPDDNSIYHLDLNVNNVNLVSYHIDPIDSLQILFDEWYLDNLEYTLGDINQDQNIDVLDVVSLVNIILGSLQPSLTEELSSDINEDNVINIQDIIILIAIIID
mgnify:CR=1 FL=1|tara:strand:+ start:3115 stop:4005 length:891 start_codon:yes stop_codon:yes gene_type:complete